MRQNTRSLFLFHLWQRILQEKDAKMPLHINYSILMQNQKKIQMNLDFYFLYIFYITRSHFLFHLQQRILQEKDAKMPLLNNYSVLMQNQRKIQMNLDFYFPFDCKIKKGCEKEQNEEVAGQDRRLPKSISGILSASKVPHKFFDF